MHHEPDQKIYAALLYVLGFSSESQLEEVNPIIPTHLCRNEMNWIFPLDQFLVVSE